jgi:16S rRNA processing protein RimM
VAGRIAVGRINAVWGLKGQVKVTPFTSNPHRLEVGATVLVRGEPVVITDHVEPYGYPILRFDRYPDRTEAQVLRGEMIEIEEEDLPPPPAGEYYIHDLVGLEVTTVGGERLGRLAEVLQTGANDVYIVRREGARDILLPAIGQVIVEVDLEAGTLLVDPLPGLLD